MFIGACHDIHPILPPGFIVVRRSSLFVFTIRSHRRSTMSYSWTIYPSTIPPSIRCPFHPPSGHHDPVTVAGLLAPEDIHHPSIIHCPSIHRHRLSSIIHPPSPSPSIRTVRTIRGQWPTVAVDVRSIIRCPSSVRHRLRCRHHSTVHHPSTIVIVHDPSIIRPFHRPSTGVIHRPSIMD